uniref:holo-[acyl-carrier-protein] synthase n=1 Tax=Kwoniella dejecticola CBS 10117 TaxID=1296121 RepID=A0A1A5ZX80_9TREE|nr:4'-phosphopantetheinyl transferase [Kwoniella dejecticola CBS 10117]OBR82418.1 4'-phosphopantetheinyl transferase [Kwoniella dejecticola CBS 10117]
MAIHHTYQTFDRLATLIEPAGRERIKRFRLPDDALRSLVARLSMTWFLHTNGLLVGDQLPTFGRKGKGKPTLATPPLDPPMEFNNTHESSFILFAVLRSHSPLACVGIDIMAPVSDPKETQEGISYQLTLQEKLSMSVPMSDEERNDKLMKLWTLKEGYTKAVGEGITFGMERIEVILDKEGKTDRVKIDGKDSSEIGWEWRQGIVAEDDEGRNEVGEGQAEEGEVPWQKQKQKQKCVYALWWRGEDAYPHEDASMRYIPWAEFEGPLLELISRRERRNDDKKQD